MGTQIIATQTMAWVPVNLVVNRNGGVEGLTVVYRVRFASTAAYYYDFDDSTFKSSGWTTKERTMIEVSGGNYYARFPIGSITNLGDHKYLTVEYVVSGAVNGTDTDIINIFAGDVIDETHKIMGLDSDNAMSVSKTARSAGDITQTISDAAGTVTVTRT